MSLTRTAAGLAALAVSATMMAAVGARPAAAGVRPACPAGAAEAISARALAVACGGRVEVVGGRTEHDQVFANPDGSGTVVSSPVPRFVKRAGQWAPVDTTVRRRSDGRLAPGAVARPLSLSGGGAGPLVTMTTPAGEWSLSWPAPLPVPRTDGGVALYPDVRPGVDLRIKVVPTGVSLTLVVRTRAATVDPAVRRVVLAVDGPALRARRDGAGAEAVGPDGTVALSVGGASMWDSRGAGAPSGASTADGPGDAARGAVVGVRVSGRHLVLEADAGLLDDPGLVLPVYLDPQITAPRSRWAYANTANANYDDTGGVARVGRNPECCGGTWRGFFEFGLGQVAGTRILAASFNTVAVHSWNCVARPVSLYRTGAIAAGVGDGGRTPWSPAALEALGTQNIHGCNGGQPLSFLITGPVQAWADAASGSVTLGLINPNESSVEHWKKFAVAQTFLVINYNTPPAVGARSTTGTSQRVDCVGEPAVNATGGVRLSATVTDPDAGSSVRGRFAWQDVTAGTPVVELPETAAVTPPHTFEVELPAASVPDGHRIRWRVRGFDGTHEGTTSPWCEFRVENSSPGQPTINAPELAPFPAAPAPTTVVGAASSVTFSPAPGDTDIVGYYYAVGTVETTPTIWVPAAFNGNATAPVVAVASGLNRNFLIAVAVDAAGNRSPLPFSAPDAPGTRQFRANAAGAVARVRGDATGDGRADVTTLAGVGSGSGAVALWRWNATAGGAVTQPIAPQDVATTYPSSGRTVQGDFDGDGLADVAVFTQQGADVALTVQRSARNGVFGAPSLTLAGWNVANIRPLAGNFDADAAGRDDIAVVFNNGNVSFSIRLLIANGGPGEPTFAAPATWYTNPAGSADFALMKVFATDLDGDGRVDVGNFYQYASCQTKLWVHFNTGSAFTTGNLLWDSGVNNWCWDRMYHVSGDFDADGRGDIAAFYRYDSCLTRLFTSYGNANRTITPFTAPWEDLTGAWCADRATYGAGDVNGDGLVDVTAVYRCCNGHQARLFTFTAAGRSFGAPVRRWEGATGPPGTRSNPNVVVGASGAASSSAPDSWGWSVRAVTDGAWGGVGWSSWSNLETPHTEWLELTLPASRDINRVDLFPRGDAGFEGDNFPSNFTIEVWTGSAWLVVVSRTGYPQQTSGAGQTFTFPTRNTNRIRVVGTSLPIMQFAEVEAYLQ
jgi:hypothetical protein